MLRTLALTGALLANAALGQTVDAGVETPAEEAPHSKTLAPLHVDIKGTLDTDILLLYVELGASADLALLKLGPGTLGVGASFDVGFCGSFCWAFSALTQLDYWQHFYSPMARLRYDIPLPAARASPTEKINAYGFLMGGVVITSMGLSTKNGTIKVEGNDASVGIGIGGGAQYFFTSNVFGGAEATFRYARGKYTWRVVIGSYELKGNEDTWSLTGFNLKFMIGVRLP